MRQKVHSLEELVKIVATARAEGKRVVHCHGVFDLMHPGHVLHFKAARQLGDVLVVTLTRDRNVNKGPGRPVFNERLRAETIAAVEYVDHVALNDWPTAVETIRAIKPHLYVKGSDYANPAQDLTGKILDEKRAIEELGGQLVFTNEEQFSSSTLINRWFSNMPTRTSVYLKELRDRHPPAEVLRALDSFQDTRVLVVGEAILDQYHYCHPLGKVPKETIVAARYMSDEDFAGGSVAIANHLAGFTKSVTLVTCLGEDPRHYDYFRSKLRPNVDLRAVRTNKRQTIIKRRYVEAAHLTKLFEIQYLDDAPLPDDVEREVKSIIDYQVKSHDVILAADFGHGLLAESIRESLMSSGKFLAVNTQMNSANMGFNPATKYRRLDYCCVHEGELKLALRVQYGDVPALAARLRKELNAQRLTVTRGPTGSITLTDDGVTETPALSFRVVDRVGAGDAYFAITSLCAYKKVPPDVMGFLGNCTGALAVEIVCNRDPVDPVALRKFVAHVLA